MLESLLEWARLRVDRVTFNPNIVDLHELAARTTNLPAPGGDQKSGSV